jgi:hypothetical protein
VISSVTAGLLSILVVPFFFLLIISYSVEWSPVLFEIFRKKKKPFGFLIGGADYWGGVPTSE